MHSALLHKSLCLHSALLHAPPSPALPALFPCSALLGLLPFGPHLCSALLCLLLHLAPTLDCFLALLCVPTGSLLVLHAQVPKGEEWRNRPRPCATLRVYNMDFFRKIVLRHDTGLGEAYMEQVGAGIAVEEGACRAK